MPFFFGEFGIMPYMYLFTQDSYTKTKINMCIELGQLGMKQFKAFKEICICVPSDLLSAPGSACFGKIRETQ